MCPAGRYTVSLESLAPGHAMCLLDLRNRSRAEPPRAFVLRPFSCLQCWQSATMMSMKPPAD